MDQSFIKDVLDNKKNQTLVSSIIAMAHNLELSVVAEGIETHPPQLKFIKDNGCDYFQGGYYVSKPVEMKAFTELLKTKTILCDMPANEGDYHI